MAGVVDKGCACDEYNALKDPMKIAKVEFSYGINSATYKPFKVVKSKLRCECSSATGTHFYVPQKVFDAYLKTLHLESLG
jgi:hypothetical protein